MKKLSSFLLILAYSMNCFASSFIDYQSNKDSQEIAFAKSQLANGGHAAPPGCIRGTSTSERIVVSKSTLFQMFKAGYYHDLFSDYGQATKIKDGQQAQQNFRKANAGVRNSLNLLTDMSDFISDLYPGNAALSFRLPDGFNELASETLSRLSSSERAEFQDMLRSLKRVIQEHVQFYLGLVRHGRICDISYEKYYGLRLYTQGAYLLFGRPSSVDANYYPSLQFTEGLMVSLLPHLRPFNGSIYIGTYLNESEWSSYQPGEEFSYDSFMSGSANDGFVSFIKNAVLVVRKNKTGRLISSLSTYPYEGEVLWAQPSFRILKATKDGRGRLWLEVEEI